MAGFTKQQLESLDELFDQKFKELEDLLLLGRLPAQRSSAPPSAPPPAPPPCAPAPPELPPLPPRIRLLLYILLLRPTMIL